MKILHWQEWDDNSSFKIIDDIDNINFQLQDYQFNLIDNSSCNDKYQRNDRY